MSEISSEVKTRQQPRLQGAGSVSAIKPLTPDVLARRRRFVRVLFLVTLLGGAGLSAIPRRTYGTGHSVTTSTNDGVSAQVHEFTFKRDYGLPFRTATTTIGDNGELKSFSSDGTGMIGILGNMLFAAAGMVGISKLLRRKR